MANNVLECWYCKRLVHDKVHENAPIGHVAYTYCGMCKITQPHRVISMFEARVKLAKQKKGEQSGDA